MGIILAVTIVMSIVTIVLNVDAIRITRRTNIQLRAADWYSDRSPGWAERVKPDYVVRAERNVRRN